MFLLVWQYKKSLGGGATNSDDYRMMSSEKQDKDEYTTGGYFQVYEETLF